MGVSPLDRRGDHPSPFIEPWPKAPGVHRRTSHPQTPPLGRGGVEHPQPQSSWVLTPPVHKMDTPPPCCGSGRTADGTRAVADSAVPDLQEIPGPSWTFLCWNISASYLVMSIFFGVSFSPQFWLVCRKEKSEKEIRSGFSNSASWRKIVCSGFFFVRARTFSKLSSPNFFPPQWFLTLLAPMIQFQDS